MSESNASFTESARRTIRMEAEAVTALEPRIGEAFTRACQIFLDTRGRVIVTGMGKSGHVATKIAATLASTGTPAFFVHPGEAGHGDMGMIPHRIAYSPSLTAVAPPSWSPWFRYSSVWVCRWSA